MAYSAVFMGNMGNYHSFGDSKFVPGLPKESFAKLVNAAAGAAPAAAAAAGGGGVSKLQQLWEAVGDKIYSLEDGEREFGFSPAGCSAYYSPGESPSDT